MGKAGFMHCVMKHHHCHEALILQRSVQCKVRIEKKDSDPFDILVGLHQGDSYLMLIFNVIFFMIVEITLQRLEKQKLN